MFNFKWFNRGSPIKHIIGRVTFVFDNIWSRLTTYTKTVDETIPDYVFWDNFRHGKSSGYELSGLLAQGFIEIVGSWVIGRAVNIRLAEVKDARMTNKVEFTNDALRRFMRSNQKTITTVYEDYLALGDQFVLVNSDGQLTVISPSQVEIKYDELGEKVIGYKVFQQNDTAQIIDEYTATTRTRTVIKVDPSLKQQVKTITNYRVLINKIPIVHFANDRKPNERRGRPVYEALLKLWSEMNDMVIKGVQGTKVAGNPLPVFENLTDPDETINRLATEEDETYIDKDGNEATRKEIKWDELAAIVLGEGGVFKFAAPEPGFSQDIINVFGLLFGLMLNRLHTPEYLWAKGRDFADGVKIQTPAWVRYVEGLRDKFAGLATDEIVGTEALGGLHELAEIWLKTKALTNNKIFVGPTVIQWTDLTETDEKQTFEWVKYLVSRGYMTGKTALTTSQLVENIDEEFEAAQAELEKNMLQQQEFDDFGGSDQDPLTADTTPDERKANKGADAPRMPAFAGGGRN